jgi:hypothetical protein
MAEPVLKGGVVARELHESTGLGKGPPAPVLQSSGSADGIGVGEQEVAERLLTKDRPAAQPGVRDGVAQETNRFVARGEGAKRFVAGPPGKNADLAEHQPKAFRPATARGVTPGGDLRPGFGLPRQKIGEIQRGRRPA